MEPAKFAEAAPVEAVAPQIAPEEMTEETCEESEKPVPMEIPQAAAGEEIPAEKSTSDTLSTEPLPVFTASSAGGTDDMAKRESETAAAWASWRKIRETGGSKPAPPAEEWVKDAEDPVPQHKAAMAVAAGVERKPEEATSSIDPEPEIATIVDSVLADLRPKIVEEIARKLGKKK